METELLPTAITDVKAQQDLLSAGSEGNQHDSDNRQSESMKTEQDLNNAGSEGLQQDLCHLETAIVKVEQDNSIHPCFLVSVCKQYYV